MDVFLCVLERYERDTCTTEGIWDLPLHPPPLVALHLTEINEVIFFYVISRA